MKDNWQDIGNPQLRHSMKIKQQQEAQNPTPEAGAMKWTPFAIRQFANPPQLPSRTDLIAKQDAQKQTFDNWDWQNPDHIGPDGQPLPVLAQGWKPNGEADFGEGLKGWFKGAVSKVETAYWSGYEEGLKITGLRQAVTKKVQGAEQGQATLDQLAAERKPTTETGAYFTGAVEATKEVFNQALWGTLDLLAKPAELTEQAIGAAVLTIGDQAKGQKGDWQRNWDASRLAYSMVFDSTIRAEMNRLVDQGIRPELAQQIIQKDKPWTIWPELIGQFVADPMLVVGWVGKGREAAKVEKGIRATFREVVDGNVADIIKQASNIGDDAIAARQLKEIMTSEQGLAAVGGHMEKIVAKANELGSLEEAYKLNALTADGKVSHLSNQVSEVLLHIINNSNESDALELMRGMVLSASKDSFEAAEGVSTMLHFADPVSLFSEAGNATTAMLKHGIDMFGEKWFDDMATALKKGGKPELVNSLFDKIDQIGNTLYPPVVDMLTAEKKASTLLAEGKTVDAATKRLADMAKDLPNHVKQTAIWHDRLQKFPVGPLNRFFVGAYLGWNPGYAARNYANNVLTMLVDYGPSILLGSSDEEFNAARRLHGAAEYLPGAHGFSLESNVATARKVEKQDTSLKGIAQAAKEGLTSLQGPSRTVAETIETNAAKKIVARTYRRTFNTGVKAMVKETEQLLTDAGFSKQFVNRLPTLIEQSGGDVNKLVDTIRAEHASGSIRLFNDFSRISDGQRRMLEDLGKWDEYVNKVLVADTKDNALQAAQKIYDDLNKYAEGVFSEGIPSVGETGQNLQRLAEQGHLGQVRGQLIEIREIQNDKAIQTAQNVLAELDNVAERFAAQTGQTLGIGELKKNLGITGQSTWGTNAKTESRRLRQLLWDALDASKEKGADLEALWHNQAYREFFADLGDAPGGLTPRHFGDAIMHQYDYLTNGLWTEARDKSVGAVTTYMDELASAGVPVKEEWRSTIEAALQEAQQYENIQIGRAGQLQAAAEPLQMYGQRTSQIAEVAQRYGISTAVTKTGTFIPTDEKTLAIINKYAQTRYSSLEEVPVAIADAAFARKTGVQSTYRLEKLAGQYGLAPDEIVNTVNKFLRGEYTGEAIDKAKQFTEVGQIPEDTLRQALRQRLVQGEGQVVPKGMTLEDFMTYADQATNAATDANRLLPPYIDGEAPSLARVAYDRTDDIRDAFTFMQDDIAKNFDKMQAVDPLQEKAIQTLEKEFSQKIAEIRQISSRTAQHARAFTLLDYSQKKYYDVALAYLYPFGFWHRGTYANWITRMATNPSVIGAYARYKDDMATIHAGMPEWWKYNLNTNDLPGVDTDHPMYLNLEATLWPLNGITGTDFNDPYKRVNWWTYTLDFMNKFGPSTWTPINMITGLILHQQGQQEAGDRWIGRLIPQSVQIKAAASYFGIGNLETDPFVTFLMDGLDPYERRRVGRSLSAMEQEAVDGISPYSREQVYDAAYNQTGPIWDEAVKRAVNERAQPNLTSFLFGVGFKNRTQEDMQVDNFYQDYYRLWGMEPNLKPDEFRNAMDGLREKYPFMETVLISRRSGVDRDRGLAYNALSRIPPGRTNDYAELVGLSGDLLNRFYDEKGHIENWSEADQKKFMSGVLELDSLLQIPTTTTRTQWSDAKNAYSEMQDAMKQRFGDGILDQIDFAFGLKKQSADQFNAYLDNHPTVQAALDFRSQSVITDTRMSPYYGGMGVVEGYLKSKMYDELEKEFGKGIFDILATNADLKTFGDPKEAKAYYNAHKKEIKAYYTKKDALNVVLNQRLAKFSSYLPKEPEAALRPDNSQASQFQQKLQQQQGPPQVSFGEWQQITSPHLMNLIVDYYQNGNDLSYPAQQQLDRMANQLGYNNGEDVLQAIGTSMYQQLQQGPQPVH